MSNNTLHIVTFAKSAGSKPIQVFKSATDVEALQFALSFHNASNLDHVIRVCRCEGTKLFPYCTLIK